MAPGDPVFGAEVLEVDPSRTRLTARHRGDEAIGEMARKGLDDNLAGGDIRKRCFPVPHLDALNLLDR